MDWSYVAGYFDGEGSVSCSTIARGESKKTHALFWFNTHRPSLDAMRAFMGVGVVRERLHGLKKKRAFVLQIGRKVDLLHALDHMIPHLLIKREKADALRAYLIEHVNEGRNSNFGKVAAVSTEQLQVWYDSGESLGDIGRRLGVGHTAVLQAFRLRGIPTRTQAAATGLRQKGVPKSDETRAKMKVARRARSPVTR